MVDRRTFVRSAALVSVSAICGGCFRLLDDLLEPNGNTTGPSLVGKDPRDTIASESTWPTSMADFKFPFSGTYDYVHGQVWKITCGYGCYKHKNMVYPAAGYYSIDLVRDDGGATTRSYVLAPARGRVVFAEWMSGYGWCVVMDHDDGHTGTGYTSIVAHLNCDPNAFVTPTSGSYPGDDLLQGTLVGVAGKSGTEVPHIHFSVWKDNVSVPLNGISGGVDLVTGGRYCSGNRFRWPPKNRTTCPG